MQQQTTPCEQGADGRIEDLKAQLRKADERERVLLAMLQSEQAARRELEQKMLPMGERKGFWARLFSR